MSQSHDLAEKADMQTCNKFGGTIEHCRRTVLPWVKDPHSKKLVLKKLIGVSSYKSGRQSFPRIRIVCTKA